MFLTVDPFLLFFSTVYYFSRYSFCFCPSLRSDMNLRPTSPTRSVFSTVCPLLESPSSLRHVYRPPSHEARLPFRPRFRDPGRVRTTQTPRTSSGGTGPVSLIPSPLLHLRSPTSDADLRPKTRPTPPSTPFQTSSSPDLSWGDTPIVGSPGSVRDQALVTTDTSSKRLPPGTKNRN